MIRDFPTEYREWLKNKVRDPNYDPWNYNKLFIYLSLVEFRWSIQLDEDRAEDGKRLRYKFGVEKNIPEKSIRANLDISNCNVLELLVALSLRCCESITIGVPGYEEPRQLFWMFISNMFLDMENDEWFKEETTKEAVTRFLDRDFSRDGRNGNIVVIPNLDSRYDLRTTDIFRQVQLYVASTRDWYSDIYKLGI